MTSPVRWRVVELYRGSWYMFHDALVPASHLRRIRPIDLSRGDDRASVELTDGREILVHFLGASDRDDDRPDLIMGFRVLPDHGALAPGWIELADGLDRLYDVAAMLRDGDRVHCYPRDSAAPARVHRALPYPWASD